MPAAQPADPYATVVAALLEGIAAGELDADLPVLAAAINQRLRLLAAAQSAITMVSLRLGDRVRINHSARPLYLHGAAGTVAGWHGQRVVVQLDQPIGRYVTGEVRCPPLALDRLQPERRIPGCYAAACLRVTW